VCIVIHGNEKQDFFNVLDCLPRLYLGGFNVNVPLEHNEFLLGLMFLTSLELIHWTFCFAEDQDQNGHG
jgi:hypothetical protein